MVHVQECGYWNDFPQVYGPELYIWNIWTMACGYQGMNMYLFAAGINRPGMGFYGTEHNWQAPVNALGQPAETYEDIKRSLRDIQENRDVFLAPLCYDIGLGIPHAPGLIWRPVAKACSEAYFVLKSAGFTPQIYDYEAMTTEELLECPALWIVSDEYMEARVQENLAAYVEHGGRLILNGRVPDRTPEGEGCTLLADALGLRAERREFSGEFQKKLVLNGREYFIGTNVQPISVEVHAAVQVLALTEEGEKAALLAAYGQGHCLVLPFVLEMSFWGLAEAVQSLLEALSVQPQIRGARMLRVIPKEDGHAIVMNLHPVEVTEEITLVTEDGERRMAPRLEPHSFTILDQEDARWKRETT